MNDAFLKDIQKQIYQLTALIKTLKKALQRVPEGSLHLLKSHDSIQYLLYNEKNHSRKYIPKKNMRLIKALIQKDYDKKLLKTAESQLSVLNKLWKKADPDKLVKIYDKLPDARKALVDDRGISDEEFVKRWAEEAYERKEISSSLPEILTNRGERVRSKSEKIIADMLNDKGLAYRYEEPLLLLGFGTVHTDFKIMHPRRREIVCLEHNGMMDIPEYADKAVARVDAYEKNGYYEGDRLLLTFETSTKPLDTETLSKKLDHFFFDN